MNYALRLLSRCLRRAAGRVDDLRLTLQYIRDTFNLQDPYWRHR